MCEHFIFCRSWTAKIYRLFLFRYLFRLNCTFHFIQHIRVQMYDERKKEVAWGGPFSATVPIKSFFVFGLCVAHFISIRLFHHRNFAIRRNSDWCRKKTAAHFKTHTIFTNVWAVWKRIAHIERWGQLKCWIPGQSKIHDQRKMKWREPEMRCVFWMTDIRPAHTYKALIRERLKGFPPKTFLLRLNVHSMHWTCTLHKSHNTTKYCD